MDRPGGPLPGLRASDTVYFTVAALARKRFLRPRRGRLQMPEGTQQLGSKDHFWSTAPFDQTIKLSRWTEIVSSNMTEMDVDCERPELYDAQWRQFDLGRIQLNLIAARQQQVRRTRAMVQRGGEPFYELVYLRRGSLVLRYEDGDEIVEQGDFTFLRHGEPYEFICLGDSISHCAHVSEEWLKYWMPDAHLLGRLGISKRKTWGKPLAGLLETIADNGLNGAMLPRNVIADQIGSLLGLMSDCSGSILTTHQGNLLRRAKASLRDRFGEHDLCPAALARELGVSRRALHGIFASAGTTFGKELAEMRLKRAGQMLADPRHSRRSIGEIAACVGFADQSHFSRRFRMRFCENPAGFRKAHCPGVL